MMASIFPRSIQERSEWLILDNIHKGQAFGEITALNRDDVSPYSVEVCSKAAIILKIDIDQFY